MCARERTREEAVEAVEAYDPELSEALDALPLSSSPRLPRLFVMSFFLLPFPSRTVFTALSYSICKAGGRQWRTLADICSAFRSSGIASFLAFTAGWRTQNLVASEPREMLAAIKYPNPPQYTEVSGSYLTLQILS